MRAVGVHHVPGARRLRGPAHHLAAADIDLGDGARVLLALDDAVRAAVRVPHDGGEGHRGEGVAGTPEGIDLRRPPALDVGRHVLDDGRELLDGPDPVRGVDVRVHVRVEHEPAEIRREVPVREVDRTIGHRPVERVLERHPPPRRACLGVEVGGHLLPFGHGLGAPRGLAELRGVVLDHGRILDEVLAQHEDDVVPVEDHVVELALVVLLEADPGRGPREVRLAARRVLVERHHHSRAGRVGHRVREVVEDVVDAGLGRRLGHDLGRDVGVPERDVLDLDPGELRPFPGEVGHRVPVERAQQHGELQVLGAAVVLDVLLGAIEGALGHRRAGQDVRGNCGKCEYGRYRARRRLQETALHGCSSSGRRRMRRSLKGAALVCAEAARLPC